MSRLGSSSLWEKITVLIALCGWCLSAQAKYGGGSGTQADPYLIYDANQMNAIGTDANDWDKHFKLMADVNLAEYTGARFNIIGEYLTPSAILFSGTFDGNDHEISNFNYQVAEGYGFGLFGAVGSKEGQAVIKNLTLLDPNVDAGTGGDAGALIGACIRNASVFNCRVVNARVRGRGGLGGLIGSILSGSVEGCGSSGDIVAATLGTSFAPAGGLIGINNFGIVSQCWSSGSVSSDGDTVGGLIGHNADSVSDCYSSAAVEGKEYVGGLLGLNSGDIAMCYSVGSVSGTGDYVGGFLGASTTMPTACFWDIETSGLSHLWAGTGLTTEQMQTESTFTDAGWDFIEVWDIGENQTYPFLRTYAAGDINHDGVVDFRDIAYLAESWLRGV